MKRRILLSGLLALLVIASFVSAAQAAPTPLYDVKATWGDTNLTPGAAGQFVIWVRNIGEASSEEPFTVTDQLPEGVKVTQITWNNIKTSEGQLDLSSLCSGGGTETATCSIPPEKAFLVPQLAPAPGSTRGVIANPSGYVAPIYVDVTVDSGATGTGTNTATFSGGGSLAPLTDVDQVPLAKAPSPFGIVPGSFLADFFDAEYPFGSPSRQAGDRPFELRVDFDLNEKTVIDPDDGTRSSIANGSIRDADVRFPRGFIGNPEALPKCPQDVFAQGGATSNSTACPADTQIGYLRAQFTSGTVANGRGSLDPDLLSRVAVYNLQPPVGKLADFGFNAGGFVQGHIYPELDPAHHYSIKTLTPNISGGVRVKNSEVTIWGVPGDPGPRQVPLLPAGDRRQQGPRGPLGLGADPSLPHQPGRLRGRERRLRDQPGLLPEPRGIHDPSGIRRTPERPRLR